MSTNPTRRSGCRILLAEDHEVVRRRLKDLLEYAGHRVVGEARDGLEAAGLAGALSPEIAILDISMPILDGLAACPRILRVSPQTRLIALSTDGDNVFLLAAHQAGFHGFVVKHLAAEQLEHAIQVVLSGSSHEGPPAGGGDSIRNP